MSQQASFDEIINVMEEVSKKYRPKRNPVMNWKAGDLCYVDIKGVKYEGRVLATAFSAEGNYIDATIEITNTVTGLDGKVYSQVWVHPKPIQSYKLRKRVA